MTESKVVHNVPTCIQSYSWDCGLACSSMVLRYLGFDPHNVYTSDLDSLQCGESIWTIDLAVLLQKYDIQHKLCTITIGVDKTYSKERFYKRRFTSDEERVNKLFQDAFTLGIIIEKRSVTMEEIIEHIQLGNIAVFLVDWNYLECIWCDRHRCRTCMCFPCLNACCDGYQGHYVVVCGFDLKKRRLFYKNPAFDTELLNKDIFGKFCLDFQDRRINCYVSTRNCRLQHSTGNRIRCRLPSWILRWNSNLDSLEHFNIRTAKTLFVEYSCLNFGYDSGNQLCCSRMDKFDIARKSYGTDEDVVFVYKDGKS